MENVWYNIVYILNSSIKLRDTVLRFAELYKIIGGNKVMKHVKTLNKANLKETASKGGCGECQTSCQSACKTSCTVANQKCEKF